MELAEIRDGAKVRQVARRQYAKPHVLAQTPLDAPRTEHPHAIPVHQHLGHHSRIVGRLPARFVSIHRIQRRQVQMVDHIADEVDQMILGQPFTQARGKQKPLFWKVRTVALAHDPLCTTAVPPAQSLLSTVRLSQTHLTSPTDYFSDTLLGVCGWGIPPPPWCCLTGTHRA